MSKIGVIDIGSNSVRMVIFDAMARAPHYIFNEKAHCRLGEGLGETGKLSPEGVALAKSELQRFVFVAQAMNVSSLEIVATAAVREARDGHVFTGWVQEALGQKLRILSGEEEAQLSAQGVLLGWPDASGIVCDMGGSSMELVNVEAGVVGQGYSTNLGPLALEGHPKGSKKAVIAAELDAGFEAIGKRSDQLYLVGGSWRAFAKIDMLRRDYPFHVLHEYTMTPKDIEKTYRKIKADDALELSAQTGVSMARLELLPSAAKVLRALVRRMKPDVIAISAYGLREGLLYDAMPSWMRAADPLITAAEAMEQELARVPGYGRSLYDWLAPLRVDHEPGEDRIALAACLLHDTNWRFHPDFRAQIGFELVAQANICGVTHEERVFLALALAARYENNPDYADRHPMTAIVSEKLKENAWSLGRAMRLGAMLSASVPGLLNHVTLDADQDRLSLSIDSHYRALYGESVQKRLESLGKIMGRKVEVSFN